MTDQPRVCIAEVNALDEHDFIATFGDVFEATPRLAAEAGASRPFADRDAMLDAFDAAALALDEHAVVALLRSHPVLGGSAPMAPASKDEQASAGLRDLHGERSASMARDNTTYLERFGFPFIIAVRGLAVDDIAAALAERLTNDADTERATALAQVRRIAALRLDAKVAP